MMLMSSEKVLVVEDVLLASCQGAFFYDDQLAIRAGVEQNGFLYTGNTVTPGFSSIRMPAGAVSIGLVLSDQTVVWGDMVSVQYAGAGGRDLLFNTEDIIARTQEKVVPKLKGLQISSFKDACAFVFGHREGQRLPVAIEYGVSQALLRATAHAHRQSMADLICSEFGLPKPTARVPLYAQSGDNRETNVDKMILRSVDILPHGLINSKEKFGPKGEKFLEFASWVKTRIGEIGAENYQPRLHFDVYGWVGFEFDNDPSKIAEFIARATDILCPFIVHIECPADFGSLAPQLEGYASIVAELKRLGSDARIVADEHCNTLSDIRAFVDANAAHIVQIKMPDVGSLVDTIEAVLYAKSNGVGAYVGGTCAETDVSAIASTHIAVATQADMMLAKPGMGVDEGLCIVGNEQSRLIALFQSQAAKTKTPAVKLKQ